VPCCTVIARDAVATATAHQDYALAIMNGGAVHVMLTASKPVLKRERVYGFSA